MTQRLDLLHTILQKKRVDGLLISHQPNIIYLTGFLCSDSYLLITPKLNFFITDPRYYYQALSIIKGFEIKLGGRSIYNTVARLAKSQRIKRLGFEAKNLDFARYQRFKGTLHLIHFVSTQNLIEELRKIKDSEELTKIKKAVGICILALKQAQKIIHPGLSEIEIAAELERFIRNNGARKSSFETIVASGENSAYPHHLTSERKLKKSECVLIDIGVDYQGYKSDLTRIFFLGKIPSKIREIYSIVEQAKARAIKKIKPGVKFSEVDRSARQYIAKHGYGGFFAHNLGHGIGLEIHEQPYISTSNKAIVEAGMVFTVEPAIYLPGKFGIRLEDDIVVTKRGCEVLNAGFDKRN